MEDRSTTSREASGTNELSGYSDLKASRRVLADRSVDVIFKKNLPEAGIRQVPVHVQRRTERVVVPLPRPAKEKQSEIKPEHRTPNRRRRNRIDGGEDSDSDSEHDDPKRMNEEDVVLSMAKKNPPKSHDGGTLERLEREELERVRQLRLLREIGDIWMQISQKREAQKKYAPKATSRLIEFRDVCYERPPVSQAVIDHNEKLENYLDEALYGHIKDNPMTLHATDLTDMEEIIYRVEAGVLLRCNNYEGLQLAPGKPQHLQLSESLSRLETEIWKSTDFLDSYEPWLEDTGRTDRPALDVDSSHDVVSQVYARETVLSQPHHEDEDNQSLFSEDDGNHFTIPEEVNDPTLPEDDDLWHEYQPSILWAIDSFIEDRCTEPEFTRHHRTFVDEMVDEYWYKIADKMCDAAMSPQTEIYTPDGKWTKFLQDSRQNGRLTSDYIEWVVDGVDASKLDELRGQWHASRRKVVLDQFRASTGAVRMTVSQEFCENLVASQPVSLLVVKNNFPTGLKEVSRKDLMGLGWHRESDKHSYWRCVLTDDRKDILKVSMNDEILGLFGLMSGGFHEDFRSWVLIEVAEDRSQEPQPRPIDLWEAGALGL